MSSFTTAQSAIHQNPTSPRSPRSPSSISSLPSLEFDSTSPFSRRSTVLGTPIFENDAKGNGLWVGQNANWIATEPATFDGEEFATRLSEVKLRARLGAVSNPLGLSEEHETANDDDVDLEEEEEEEEEPAPSDLIDSLFRSSGDGSDDEDEVVDDHHNEHNIEVRKEDFSEDEDEGMGTGSFWCRPMGDVSESDDDDEEVDEEEEGEGVELEPTTSSAKSSNKLGLIFDKVGDAIKKTEREKVEDHHWLDAFAWDSGSLSSDDDDDDAPSARIAAYQVDHSEDDLPVDSEDERPDFGYEEYWPSRGYAFRHPRMGAFNPFVGIRRVKSTDTLVGDPADEPTSANLTATPPPPPPARRLRQLSIHPSRFTQVAGRRRSISFAESVSSEDGDHPANFVGVVPGSYQSNGKSQIIKPDIYDPDMSFNSPFFLGGDIERPKPEPEWTPPWQTESDPDAVSPGWSRVNALALRPHVVGFTQPFIRPIMGVGETRADGSIMGGGGIFMTPVDPYLNYQVARRAIQRAWRPFEEIYESEVQVLESAVEDMDKKGKGKKRFADRVHVPKAISEAFDAFAPFQRFPKEEECSLFCRTSCLKKREAHEAEMNKRFEAKEKRKQEKDQKRKEKERKNVAKKKKCHEERSEVSGM